MVDHDSYLNGGALEINSSARDVNENHNTNVVQGLKTLQEINDAETMLMLPVIVFYVTIMVIGIIGNIFVLIIYTYRFKRMSARYYILSLAMLDLIVCCIGIPYHLLDLLHPYTYFYSDACKALTSLITFFKHGSTFVLLVVGIDRFLKICRPLKMQVSDFGPRKACLIAVGLGLLSSWPQGVIYGHSTAVPSGQRNITGVECFVDDSYKDTGYPLIYLGFTIFLAISIIITLIVLYSCICYQIFLHDKFQEDLLRKMSRLHVCTCAETNNHTNVEVARSLPEEETEDVPLNTFETENQKEKDIGNGDFERSRSSSRSHFKGALSSSSRKEESHIKCIKSVKDLPWPVAASKKKQKTTRKITLMMCSITIIFIISHTPSIAMSVADRLVEGLWEETDATKIVFYDFLLRSYVINNVVNPIIYGFWDNRFRLECIRIIKGALFCPLRNVDRGF